MNNPLIIDYYTDVLCVWAWIAQRRIDELNDKLGNKIKLQCHYTDLFGDVPTKMETQCKLNGTLPLFRVFKIEKRGVSSLRASNSFAISSNKAEPSSFIV